MASLVVVVVVVACPWSGQVTTSSLLLQAVVVVDPLTTSQLGVVLGVVRQVSVATLRKLIHPGLSLL